MTHSYINTSVLNPVILNTNNIINLLSHPLSLSDYVWIVHSTLVTITTYTTDEVIIFIFVYVLWYQMNGKHPCRTTWMIHVYGLDFQHHMSWSLFCSVSERWEVIVRFIDIDGIVDHHWLNFLFINISEILCFYYSIIGIRAIHKANWV
jgi:hypothetical protein